MCVGRVINRNNYLVLVKNISTKYFAITLLSLFASVIFGCGGGAAQEPTPVLKDNNAPIANAGVDQNVETGTLVVLNGGGSTDSDGDSLTYIWTLNDIPTGSTTSLVNATSQESSLTVDMDGSYEVTLVVNDGTINSSPDIVIINSSTPNSSPIADAGSDQSVETGSSVILSGNGSTDADDDPLTYEWSLDSRPAGSSAQLSDTRSAETNFIADLDGTYLVSLVVSDGTAESSPDSVTITSNSTASSIPPRIPSAIGIKQIHSGHSLTDAAMFAQPWPGHSIHIWSEVNPNANYYDLLGKSTIPGSPMWWRWQNTVCCGAPDARNDIADWELLVITEGVPFSLSNGTQSGSYWYTDHLEWMRVWVEHAWSNGNSGEGMPILLFATWTDLEQGDSEWRDELDLYKPLWEQMADYGAENLPSDAYIYIIPGNILMMRFYDDISEGLVPGVSSIHEFFDDTIHPNGLGSYSLALLHLAVIHHINPNTVGFRGYNLTPEPSPELAEYIQSTVWEVATDYARSGIPKN